MSKEQLTDQQADVGAATTSAPVADQSHGLPPHVYAQVSVLGPADAPALSDLLILYPSFSSKILAVAAPQVGNAAVQRAIALTQAKQSARGKGGAMSQDEMHEMLEDSPAPAKSKGPQHPLSQAEMREMLEDSPAPAKPKGPQHPLTQAEMREMLEESPAHAGPRHPLSQAEMREMLEDSPAP